MVSDPIADLLIRIKNSYLAERKTTEIPYFKTGENLIKILDKEGFIDGFKIKEQPVKTIVVNLKYNKKEAALTGVVKFSKPGMRVYISYKKIRKYLRGLGIVIISTPKGLMTAKEALKQKIGGEIICKIW